MIVARIRAAAGWTVSAADWVWRDPVQAIETEVRPAWLRRLAHCALVGRLLLGELDIVNAVATLRWRAAGAQLVPSENGGDAWLAVSRRGRPLTIWPRRLSLRATAAAVVVVVHAERGFLWGRRLESGRPAVLATAPGRFGLRVLPLGEAVQLRAAPISGLGVLWAELRRGSPLDLALRSALPPRPRRMGSPPDRRYRRHLQKTSKQALRPVSTGPLVSVLMPVHDPDPAQLAAALASVAAQTYGAWELRLVDDGSSREEVRAILAHAARDPRVALSTHARPAGVSAATNTALAAAMGEIVAFMDHDDLLAPDALAVMAEAFEDPGVQAAYSDEDTVDLRGAPRSPTFKTRFDPERLLSQNFVNHLFCARTSLVRALGGLREGLEGAQDHDLVLRIAQTAPQGVRHVPRVLYHWRRYPGGSSLSQTRAATAALARRRAVQDHLAARGLSATVETGPDGFNRLRWPLPAPLPRVRVIIPTRDRPDLLSGCVGSLLMITDYARLDVAIVDNGSTTPRARAELQTLSRDPRVRVISHPGSFNHSALNNLAAGDEGADVLCLMNDDVLTMEPSWLREMVSLALRPEVGAVGAKLFYPDGRIQHAGVVLGLGDLAVAGHELRGAPPDAIGLQSRLLVTREVDAVTAACLVVERRKYMGVGGLDAETFPVAFNDVDLCLRLERAGWKTLWTPHARLIHLESASRASRERDLRLAELRADAMRMKARWGARLDAAADYHPALSRADETFSLA